MLNWISLTFSAPPKFVDWFAIDTSDGEFVLPRGRLAIDQYVTDTDSLTIRCVVNGSNPEPSVIMQMGRQVLTNMDGVLQSEVEKYQFYPEGDHTVGLFKVTTNLSFFLICHLSDSI